MIECGILNINKPGGMTSRDVVNRVARLVKPVKVGHAGTLDPLATGVLVVCLGKATRLIEYVQQMPKTYRATFRLGCTSPTDDMEGELVELPNAAIPTRAAVEQALPAFLGEIQQRPPAYSAIKVAGKRAYALARAGERVELAPRPVTIYAFNLMRYAYPELELEIVCGGGTYVRSLGRDLAEALGTGAVMTVLSREAIGEFKLEDAVELATLDAAKLLGSARPALDALPTMPRLSVSDGEAQQLAAGRWLRRTLPMGVKEAAAVDGRGQLVAIVTPRGVEECGASRNFSRTV